MQRDVKAYYRRIQESLHCNETKQQQYNTHWSYGV